MGGEETAAEARADESRAEGGGKQWLQQAYIYLLVANADYDGHRVKAMKHIEAAADILDRGILERGTVAQVQLALAEESAEKRAQLLRQYTPKVNKGQALSDAQLLMAAQFLARLRPVVVQHKQVKVLDHLDKAEKQIALALKSR